MANAYDINDEIFHELDIVHNSVNRALIDAVKKGNLNLVQKSLDEGAEPNYVNFVDDELLCKTLNEGQVEIVKLLLQHFLYPDVDLMACIVKSKFAKELITVIVKRDKRYIRYLFEKLVEKGDFESNSAIDILEHMLELGMPLDVFMKFNVNGFFENPNESVKFTPLQLSVLHNRASFASIFLQRGADINKKAADGSNALSLAVMSHEVETLTVLLEKNPLINERSFVGLTPLHMASVIEDPSKVDITHMLLQHGADINILNQKGGSCLNFSSSANKELLIAELARLKFEKQCICKENLNCLKVNKDWNSVFKHCLEELKRIKKRKIGNFYPLYDVLRCRRNSKKLISLMKNKDFIAVYKLARKRETIKYYARDLDIIFENALKKSEIPQGE